MTPDCLENIINKVVEERADIGIIFDGDGDRIGIIDEKGHPIRGDILTAIICIKSWGIKFTNRNYGINSCYSKSYPNTFCLYS